MCKWLMLIMHMGNPVRLKNGFNSGSLSEEYMQRQKIVNTKVTN